MWVVITGLLPSLALAEPGIPAFTSTPAPGGGTNYTLSLQTLLFMTALGFLPAALLMMSSFTRILTCCPCCGRRSAPSMRRRTR